MSNFQIYWFFCLIGIAIGLLIRIVFLLNKKEITTKEKLLLLNVEKPRKWRHLCRKKRNL